MKCQPWLIPLAWGLLTPFAKAEPTSEDAADPTGESTQVSSEHAHEPRTEPKVAPEGAAPQGDDPAASAAQEGVEGEPDAGQAAVDQTAADQTAADQAAADQTETPAGSGGASTPSESPPPPIQPPPLPANSVGGHLRVAARAGLAEPFGGIARGQDYQTFADTGAGAGLELSYGLGRDVSLGVSGDLEWLSSSPSCASCAPASWGMGLFARYHLVQGLRFDPWVAYGMGVRSLGFEQASGRATYHGWEWLKLSLGADFYPNRMIGLGPYLELGAASMLSVPEDQRPGKVTFRFHAGLRISFDVMGR